MRKMYSLLALLFTGLMLHAQTAPGVNFTFALDASTGTFTFTNKSEHLGEGTKKAYWEFGDNTPSITTGAYEGTNHHYAAPGTYKVCLKIYRYAANSNDGTLIGSECKMVTLEAACSAGFEWTRDASSTGSEIKFTGVGHSNANKIIKEVCWTFGDGAKSCLPASASTPATALLNVHHAYTQAGTYNACIRVVFDGGCVAEKCNVVTVAPVETCDANFTALPILTTSLGTKLVVNPSHSLKKKPLRICWHFGDGKELCKEYATTYTGAYWAEHVYAKAGKYEACVTVKYDGGCEKTKCNTITVSQATPPSSSCMAAIHEVAVNGASPERKFYVELMHNKIAKKICWNFGDGGAEACTTVSNPLNPQELTASHRFASPGHYTVCARVVYDGGCEVLRCKQIEVAGHTQPRLVLSPNPVVNKLNAVFLSSKQETLSVKILNANGVVMASAFTRSAMVGFNTWTFNDVALLPTGIYTMVVQSSSQVATATFFKQ